MKNKLDRQSRKLLLDAILKDRFEAEEAALRADQAALAEDIYNLTYTEAQRAAMEQFPEGFFYRSSTVYFDIGGDWRDLELQKERPVSAVNRYQTSVAPSFAKSSPIGKRFLNLEKREQAIEESKYELAAQIRAVLNSVTTLKRLIAVWPEVEVYVLRLFPSGVEKTSALVPSTSALNKALHLPKQE